MAMVPFCGYNMGDYFSHWLEMGKSVTEVPRIYFVNWFRVNAQGKFIWPGFGDNMRVLKWMFERVNGTASAVETPLGLMPAIEDLDWSGLDSMNQQKFDELTNLDADLWLEELELHQELFAKLGDKLPTAFVALKDQLKDSFKQAKKTH